MGLRLNDLSRPTARVREERGTSPAPRSRTAGDGFLSGASRLLRETFAAGDRCFAAATPPAMSSLDVSRHGIARGVEGPSQRDALRALARTVRRVQRTAHPVGASPQVPPHTGVPSSTH